MIIPSIDLMDGQTVQLVGGRDKALDAGDPRPLLTRFSRVGETAVIDLDAALSLGDHRELIAELVRQAPCRVGGGVRDEETARYWLDAGAAKIIIGTKATPEFLGKFPKDRLLAAVDAKHGEVVVEGWRTGTGASLLDRIAALRPYVGGFLVTFVEREGRLGGIDMAQAAAVIQAAAPARVTIAGGVTTAEEVAALDRLGADAQVGMALYTGRLTLADAFAAPLRSDRHDGLWPTVVADEGGRALGLVYSSRESLAEAIETGRGVYYSRSRKGLWRKGETSGAVQELLRIDADCDRDALRFTVRQSGTGFCHQGTWTCFGDDRGLPRLQRVLRGRMVDAPAGSYTRRLFNEPGLLPSKLREEARELVEAETPDDIAHEAADLLYFAMVKLAKAGVPLSAVEDVLDRRALKITRRPGNAKPDKE